MLVDRLRSIEGIVHASTNDRPGLPTYTIVASPTARDLGLTDNQVTEFVRLASDGEIITDIAVPGGTAAVYLEIGHADDPATILQTPITLSDGSILPLAQLVNFTQEAGVGEITRRDGRRVIEASGLVDETLVDEDTLAETIIDGLIPSISEAWPTVTLEPIGELVEQDETMTGVVFGEFVAVLGIYLVLVWARGDWLSPLVIMAVIPIGFCGVLFGHWLFGLTISLLSFLGILAFFGVAVNDSLVLATAIDDTITDEKQPSLRTALLAGAKQRLRPIVVTTVTTCIGLLPLLSATDEQAQFLKPMASALCLGVAFGTVLTLIVVPCLLNAANDIRAFCFGKQKDHDRAKKSSSDLHAHTPTTTQTILHSPTA
jgi:multidrug efflux pump subunit AcrB